MRRYTRTREWRVEVLEDNTSHVPGSFAELAADDRAWEWAEIDWIAYDIQVYCNAIALFTYMVNRDGSPCVR